MSSLIESFYDCAFISVRKSKKVRPMKTAADGYGKGGCWPCSRHSRLRLRIAVAVLFAVHCSKVRSADVRLVVTANVVCSVSAQFGEENRMTIVRANCSDPSQRDSAVIIPGRQSGLTINLRRQPPMQVSVETRRVSVRNKSGHLEERIIRTTTIVPE